MGLENTKQRAPQSMSVDILTRKLNKLWFPALEVGVGTVIAALYGTYVFAFVALAPLPYLAVWLAVTLAGSALAYDGSKALLGA